MRFLRRINTGRYRGAAQVNQSRCSNESQLALFLSFVLYYRMTLNSITLSQARKNASLMQRVAVLVKPQSKKTVGRICSEVSADVFPEIQR